MHEDTDVLVVGAWPVGLLMAAELRRHDVTCRIIDKLAEPMKWVKALGVSQRTLEVWDDIGIVTEALDTGVTLRRQQFSSSPAGDGRRLKENAHAVPSRHPCHERGTEGD